MRPLRLKAITRWRGGRGRRGRFGGPRASAPPDGSGGEEDGVRGDKVVVAAAQSEENQEGDGVHPAEQTPGFAFAFYEEEPEAGQPEGYGDGSWWFSKTD